MVSLMYSSGLRVGEVCSLRYCDIQRKNMRIHVTHSKNRSDRYAILSQKALDILTEYWFAYNRPRSEEHTSELQSRFDLVCRLLLEKKNTKSYMISYPSPH